MNIGERIKSRRQDLGLSAEVLAEKLGISPATMYRYENGEIEKFPVRVLEALSEILHTTPSYLMGWEDGAPLSMKRDELFEKRRLLFSLSEKATPEQLDAVIRLFDSIVEGGEDK